MKLPAWLGMTLYFVIRFAQIILPILLAVAFGAIAAFDTQGALWTRVGMASVALAFAGASLAGVRVLILETYRMRRRRGSPSHRDSR